MKHLHLVVACLLALAGFQHCNSNPGTENSVKSADNIKKIILDINKRMISTIGDKENGAKKYMSFCADTIIASSYDGGFSTSPSEVAHDQSDGVAEQPHDFTFMLRDNAAMLSFLYTSYEVFGADTIFHHLRVTKTFVNGNGRWKMASVSSSLQPVNYFKSLAESGNASIGAYSGVYQWRTGLADTITVRAGKLYSRTTSETAELNFPVNDSEYMTKNDFGRIAFETDLKGNVTGYIYTTYDGQKIHAKKIK